MLSASSFSVVVLLFLAKEIICCVVNPRELLTTVGEVVSLRCSARPNNEQRGTISNLKLENEDKSEALIFQAPVYDAKGKISTEQFVADGYFLSTLDEDLVYATIQINETQLKHGGRYVCGCTASTITTGSANLVVLADELSFVLSRGNPPTPGELLDLSCSLSFSGSISSVSVDITINDANGTQLASKENLSMTRSEGSHQVNYSFIAHGNKEQNFTCEMKVWNQSSSGKTLLRSMTSHYSLNPDSQSDVTQATVSNASAGLAVGVGFLVLVLIVSAVFVYIRCKHAQKFSTITQLCRVGGGKPTEYKKQENRTGADNKVAVENDFYDDAASRWTAPTAQPNYESIDREQRNTGLNEAYEELNLDDHSIQTAQSNYESIDREQRNTGVNEAYEELNLDAHSIQTGQYIDVIL